MSDKANHTLPRPSSVLMVLLAVAVVLNFTVIDSRTYSGFSLACLVFLLALIGWRLLQRI